MKIMTATEFFLRLNNHSLGPYDFLIPVVDASGSDLNHCPADISCLVISIFHPNIFQGFMALPVFLLIKKLNTFGHFGQMLGRELAVLVFH
jgi:hypothetical protein